MLDALRFQLSDRPVDPFSLKDSPKWSPKRALWTLQSRALQKLAGRSHRPMADVLRGHALAHTAAARGEPLTDTAVTSGQLELLEAGVRQTENIAGDIAEIGAFRGVSTVRMAGLTSRRVHAIDPFIGYGGADEDYAVFTARTGGIGNIIHLRMTSGQALAQFAPASLSMVFVDAIHDVSNSWFDIWHWSRRIAPGGILAMHDVDDHEGSNLTARRFVARDATFEPWAHCPNILLLRKAG